MKLPNGRTGIQKTEDNKIGNNTLSVRVGAGHPDPDVRPDFAWGRAKEILTGLIDDFYDSEKKMDYFKGEETTGKRRYLEKQDQQKLILHNRFWEDGFFVYDMEYEEPGGSKQKESEDSDLKSRFDLLALQVEKGAARKLWLLEVKSTLAACNDTDSGLKKHSGDMATYLGKGENLRKKARRDDAPRILNGYARLFGWRCPDCAGLENIPVEFGFVLTGDARRSRASLNYLTCKTGEDLAFRITPPEGKA
jgi:hypothetical protein